jgi:hypothetical protein
MSIKAAHLSGQIRDMQCISQREDRIVERGQHLGAWSVRTWQPSSPKVTSWVSTKLPGEEAGEGNR